MTKLKIGLVGKFHQMHDEEYIARAFEMLGHDVIRIPQDGYVGEIHRKIMLCKPEILLFTKWEYPKLVKDAIAKSKDWNMKTVCWLFDLYLGYAREFRVKQSSFFKADYVFTTDGGHDEKWKELGINHQCVRQGISAPECFMYEPKSPKGIIFIGSENPYFPERTKMVTQIGKMYREFSWYGHHDTNQVRGKDLNYIFARTKIVIGDSVYSPHYWSNRIVETLGRGGFLIHQEVEGLKEEYPHLVTYKRGDINDLKAKIDYYLEHEDERVAIVRKNFELVKEHYTMEKKCAQLISLLK